MEQISNVKLFIGTQNVQNELNIELRNEKKMLQVIATSIAKNLHENPEYREIMKGAKKTKLPIHIYVMGKVPVNIAADGEEPLWDEEEGQIATCEIVPQNHPIKTYGQIMLGFANSGDEFNQQFKAAFKIKGDEVEGFSVYEKVVTDWCNVKTKLFTIALKQTQMENGTLEGKMLISEFNKAMKQAQIAAAGSAPAAETPAPEAPANA